MEHLIQQLANASSVTQAEAADEVDKLISRIVRKLRQRHAVRLPGLGTFQPGRHPVFHMEVSRDPRGTAGQNR